jgi:hypothetical protein
MTVMSFLVPIENFLNSLYDTDCSGETRQKQQRLGLLARSVHRYDAFLRVTVCLTLFYLSRLPACRKTPCLE